MKRKLLLIVIGVLAAVSPGHFPALFHARASVLLATPQQIASTRGFLGRPIAAQAAGRGNPWVSLRDGHSLPVDYQGSSKLAEQLRNNHARPMSLAMADFDEDGVPDLVAAYAGATDGALALQCGDADAVYSNTPEARSHRAQTRLAGGLALSTDDIQSPFFVASGVFDTKGEPELIGAGDFDGDGHRDVVTTSIGGGFLCLLAGDGRGHFAPARTIALPGRVTAMATGDVNRMDGLADILVAVTSASGPSLLVYEAGAGALNAAPETISLPREANGIAIGQLDSEYSVDIAVSCGSELVIVHGRDRKHSTIEGKLLDARPPIVTRVALPFSISALAVGDFTGDLNHEIALLTDDGTCQVYARDPSIKNSAWHEASAMALPASRTIGSGAGRQLIPVRVSTSPKDDLLVLDQGSTELQVIINESATGKDRSAVNASPRLRVAGTIDVAGVPVCALGMRLNGDAVNDLVLLSSNSNAPTVLLSAPVSVFTVTNTADDGTGSLRQAMLAANSTAGADAINFNIAGGGSQTISPLTQLPSITEAVTIDATTEPGFAGTPIIEIAGNNAPAGTTGLSIPSGNTTIRGLVINRFGGLAIGLSGGGSDIIEGNYIGADVTGASAQGNGDVGVAASNGSGHRIGGATAAARNVISGNFNAGILISGPAMNDIVQGNFIGTNAAGTSSLGNQSDGVELLSGTNNVINCSVGGSGAGEGNVISANTGTGVQLLTVGTSNLVQGNLIGTNATGTVALGNGSSGVAVTDAASNTIGGTVAGAGNLISGNSSDGVRINSATSTNNLVQGNKIGTRLDGVTALPNNRDGVRVQFSASGNSIGGSAAAANIIAFNLGAGVFVDSGNHNAIQANSIFSNFGLGIDLSPQGVTPNDPGDGDIGPNDLQNFPILSSSNGAVGGGTNVQGTLNSTAGTTFTLHFYTNPSCDPSGNGEGQTFLGSANVSTNGSGNVSFNVNVTGSATVGQSITATATNPQGSTSEFSACAAYGAADLALTKIASSGTIIVGSNVTYTITLTNNGPDDSATITVSDSLPASLIFQSCDSTGGGICGGSGNDRTVSFGTLTSGASATITIVAALNCNVANGTIIGNTTSVTSPVRDPVIGNNSSTANFTASNPPRVISPASASYLAEGGDGGVGVTAPSGCGWQAITNDSWLSITSGSFGSGNGAVGYHVAVNATGSPRTGTLTIAGLTFTVNQSNLGCSFMIAPTSDSFPAAGATRTVTVTTTAGCVWNAIANDPWITFSGKSGGVGTGSVGYTVAANAAGARAGTMTVAGLTFTVNQDAAPTAVSLASFGATEYDSGVLVEWQTGLEVENLGFHVLREQAGLRVRVTPEIIGGSALIAGNKTRLTAGNAYSWWDAGIADCGLRIADCRNVQYWLEDIDIDGKSTLHGPITPRRIAGSPPVKVAALSLSRVGQTQPRVVQLPAAQAPADPQLTRENAVLWELPAKSAVKLTVREEGWYRVTQPELVAAGFDPKLDPRNLQLYLEGNEQAMLVGGEQDGSFDQRDAIEFYGVGQDTPATDAHTYWLVSSERPGKRITIRKSDPRPGGAASFAFTVERKDRTIYFASLKNGEADNFFGSVITTQEAQQSLPVQRLDQSALTGSTLEVALQGVTDLPGGVPDHQVRVSLNGSIAGSLVFDGRQHPVASFAVPHNILKEGNNVVTLVADGGPSDVSLVDYIRLTYRHSYATDQDSLRMTVGDSQRSDAQSQTISGFSNASIRTVDITNPSEPQELAGLIEDQKGGGFAATVQTSGSGPRTLIAFTADRIKHPASVLAYRPSNLRDKNHSADLLIITNRLFATSLGPLKALRQRQGYEVDIVDIQDIYDQFSFGEKQPGAVKDFLSATRDLWKKAPRFVLLVGDASYDSRNYLGAGDFDFVPTKLIDTAYLETASDDWFVDFNGDGIAEMSVGRLPVRTPDEASVLVSKIVNYDSSRKKKTSARSSVLLVADKNDGFDFEAASHRLLELIPGNIAAQEIFRGRLDDATAKKQVIDSVNAGQTIVNYAGHGSTNVWRNLLTTSDIQALNNQKSLPLFVAMTCLNGFFQEPVTESLAEGLLKSERGGAIAVWASSGLTDPVQQAAMNQQAYRLLFAGTSGLTIGEVTSKAKASVNDSDIRRTWILFGDPTTRLK